MGSRVADGVWNAEAGTSELSAAVWKPSLDTSESREDMIHGLRRARTETGRIVCAQEEVNGQKDASDAKKKSLGRRRQAALRTDHLLNGLSVPPTSESLSCLRHWDECLIHLQSLPTLRE